MNIIHRAIRVTHRVSGWHYWPDAPDHRAYLRDNHRHLFHMKLTVPVDHDNRAIEFHDLQDWLVKRYSWGHQFGPRSCEGIGAEVLATLFGRFPDLPGANIEVWEDGENGALVVADNDSPLDP